MVTASGAIATNELSEVVASPSTPVFLRESADRLSAAEAAIRAVDARLAARAEREKHLHLPARIAGECPGDHQRRGAPDWIDMPDAMPLGEEGGTAWTPDNAWLREETPETVEA